MIYVNEAGRLSRHNSLMDSSLVAAFSRKVPRYTSYPTAAQFSEAVGSVCHATWLQRLPRAALVSLYLHIPYCRQLCWYCGCHMRVARGDEPLARYSDALLAEIGTIGRTMGFRPWVERIHWGGGTPTTLRPEDFLRIHEAVKTTFEVRPGAEIAVEIDPRNLGDSMVETLAATGTTRVSFGVQDFDEGVQAAINRRQSFALTRDAVERVRRAGIGSVNIDLVYGLPRQTRESVARKIGQTLALDRGGVQGRVGLGALDGGFGGGARQLGAVVAQQGVQGVVVAVLDDDVGNRLRHRRAARDGAQMALAALAHDLDQILVGQDGGGAQNLFGDLDLVVGETADQIGRAHV